MTEKRKLTSLEDMPIQYEANKEKVHDFIAAARLSRKYGFPVINSLEERTHEKRFIHTAQLFLKLAGLELELPEVKNTPAAVVELIELCPCSLAKDIENFLCSIPTMQAEHHAT